LINYAQIDVFPQWNSYISHDATYKSARRCRTTVTRRPIITGLKPWHGHINEETTVTINGSGFGNCIDDITMVYAGAATKKWKWTVIEWVSSESIICKSTPLPVSVFKWDRKDAFPSSVDLIVVTRGTGQSTSTIKWCWTLNEPFIISPPEKSITTTSSGAGKRAWKTTQSQGNYNLQHSIDTVNQYCQLVVE
jgi:hypothetical protein